MKKNVKPIKAFIEAYACDDDGDGPQYAEILVDLAFCEKLLRLQKQCVTSNLSEVSVYDSPNSWGPGEIEDELRLTCAEMVVTCDNFWFVDQPKHASYHIETRLQGIDHFIEQLKNAEAELPSCDGVSVLLGDDTDDLAENIREAEGDDYTSVNPSISVSPVFIRCEESNLGLLKSFGMEAGDYDHVRGGVLATGPVSVLDKFAEFPEDFKMERASLKLVQRVEVDTVPLTSAAAIAQINALLTQADAVWKKLPNEERDRIISIHNYEGSIDYCLRYGMTACGETLEILGKQEASADLRME